MSNRNKLLTTYEGVNQNGIPSSVTLTGLNVEDWREIRLNKLYLGRG